MDPSTKKILYLLPMPFFVKHFLYPLILISILVCTFCFKKSSEDGKKLSSNTAFCDTVVIISYNVENLFDFVDNGTEYPEYKPLEHNWNHETHAKKFDNIASAIAAARADIVVLCEVENINAARELQKLLKRKKRSYPYIAAGTEPNPAMTCQIILSRFPIVSFKGYGIPKTGPYFTRNILEADVAIGSSVLKIFAVHWPSKRNPESQRIGSANVLLKRIKKLPEGTEYILVGDFNSNYNEAETFFTEKLDDTNGKTAINHILKTVLSSPGSFIDYVTERDLIEFQDSLFHYDTWLEIPEHRRYSYKYKGQNNTLDHILLPSSLYDSSGVSYVDNSFSVFTWDGRLIFDGIPFRWKMRYGKNGRYHIGEGYSDHLPIMAQFVVRPFSFTDGTLENRYISDSSVIQKYISGFETGFEGWLPFSDKIRLFRDTVNAAHGKYCLKVEGLAKKSTGAAYIRLPLNRCRAKSSETHTSVSLDIRGSGKFAFRMRTGNRRWTCYTGQNFSRQIKSTRYSLYSFTNWQTIQLPLPKTSKDADAVELEIRAAGNEVLCIWIDNVNWK